ncbi:MAG: hypothetical protein RDV48_20325 [Candidatus Eremiobacteraeota bacterium]|nr:hypothetical protein [Candidatus Eremiobacteraeota bacterium]
MEKMIHIPDSAVESLGSGAARLGHIGSVADVIAARIPEALLSRKFRAADYHYGFELASPRDIYSLGEALMVNGICYANSTDSSSPDYNRTISGPEFVTGGMFLVPHAVEPSHRVNYQAGDSPLALMDFFDALYGRLRHPAVFVGVAEFAEVHGTVIGKPPIDGKAIFEHKEDYYPFPEIRSNEVPAFIIGAFTDYREARFGEINAQLEVVLYKNPFDADTALSSHTHALTLKRRVEKIEETGPEKADRVLHLFTGGTAIRSVRADIYTVSGLDDYENK